MAVEYNAYEFYEQSEDWMGFCLSYEVHVNGKDHGRSGFSEIFMYNITPNVIRVYTYDKDDVQRNLMDWHEDRDGKSMDYQDDDLSGFSDDFVQHLLYACMTSDLWNLW